MKQKEIEKHYQDVMNELDFDLRRLAKNGRKRAYVTMGSGLWARRVGKQSIHDCHLSLSDTLTINLELAARKGKRVLIKAKAFRNPLMGMASYSITSRKPVIHNETLGFPGDFELLAHIPYAKLNWPNIRETRR